MNIVEKALVEGFYDFCKSKPADDSFKYTSNIYCAISQFLTTQYEGSNVNVGPDTVIIKGVKYSYPVYFDAIAREDIWVLQDLGYDTSGIEKCWYTSTFGNLVRLMDKCPYKLERSIC